MNPSLATGSPLNPETWADFVTRLRHDCVGEGVSDHCTADALFIVQARRIVSGIDPDYTDQLLVYCDDSSWYSPKEYWDDHGEHIHEKLDVLAHKSADTEMVGFMEIPEYDQWAILGDLDDHHVTGWHERWEYVNSHFTKDAADAFIKRKKHDYPEGIRVYVESQSYAWEFNTIKEAILSGLLTYSATK
nr:hypothetical protein [uncultured Rhodoferax sp.]